MSVRIQLPRLRALSYAIQTQTLYVTSVIHRSICVYIFGYDSILRTKNFSWVCRWLFTSPSTFNEEPSSSQCYVYRDSCCLDRHSFVYFIAPRHSGDDISCDGNGHQRYDYISPIHDTKWQYPSQPRWVNQLSHILTCRHLNTSEGRLLHVCRTPAAGKQLNCNIWGNNKHPAVGISSRNVNFMRERYTTRRKHTLTQHPGSPATLNRWHGFGFPWKGSHHADTAYISRSTQIAA